MAELTKTQIKLSQQLRQEGYDVEEWSRTKIPRLKKERLTIILIPKLNADEKRGTAQIRN